jgi:hypothetical protein
MVLEVEKRALYERDLQVGVNLFLGAGFSRMARNVKGQALPIGDGLKELIVTELKLEVTAHPRFDAVDHSVAWE